MVVTAMGVKASSESWLPPLPRVRVMAQDAIQQSSGRPWSETHDAMRHTLDDIVERLAEPSCHSTAEQVTASIAGGALRYARLVGVTWAGPAMRQALLDIGVATGMTPGAPLAAMSAILTNGREHLGSYHVAVPPDQRVVIRSQCMQDVRAIARSASGRPAQELRNVPGLVDLYLRTANQAQASVDRDKILEHGMKVLGNVLRASPHVIEVPREVEYSPMLRERLDEMSAERREHFDSLWQQVKHLEVRVGHGERLRATDALEHLARHHRLDATDSQGRDLLTNLYFLASVPAIEPLDSNQLAAEAAVHVAWPDESMRQGIQKTCSTALLSNMLANAEPAEFVRLARGVVVHFGWTHLRSTQEHDGQVVGARLRRVDDSIAEDYSGRTQLERLMQAALMQAGNQPAHYSNATDVFAASNGNVVQFGMHTAQFARLQAALFGGKHQPVAGPGENLMAQLRHAPRPTPCVLAWGDQLHYVAVRGITHDRVFFRNPQGPHAPSLASLEGHTIHHGGVESMPLETFTAQLKEIII
jgi:hypothetical protein